MKLDLSVDLILKDNIDCDYSIWQVATHDELRLMGGVFRNCLANSSGYEPENIYFLVYNGKPVVCIEIKEDRVYQIRSKFNNEPSTKHRKIVETWLLEMGVEGTETKHMENGVFQREMPCQVGADPVGERPIAQPRTLAGIMNAEQELQHMIDRQREAQETERRNEEIMGRGREMERQFRERVEEAARQDLIRQRTNNGNNNN